MDDTTCIIQEELPIVEPPPLNLVDDCNQTPPSLFSLEQLELIFYIIGHMMEQLHRHTLINSCIDMFFNAFLKHQPSRGARPMCNPMCSSPTMASFTLTLRMATSIVLTTPLMFNSAQFYEHHWHGDGVFFLVNLVWYSVQFLPSFNFQSLLVCLVYSDRFVSTTSRHLLWFPTNWQGKWWFPFLTESIIGGHLF
jgi:hypothetical protein